MITVIHPGMMTTVQDEGRWGYLAFGMPRAGVMDRYASRTANILCGNPKEAAVLEMTLLGGEYRFEQAGRIAICGAAMEAKLNGQPIALWQALDVKPGDDLELGFARSGCRAYLAITGGIDAPVVMGSRATYTKAAVGGINGRMLKAGDVLYVGEAKSQKAPAAAPEAWIPVYSEFIEVRVMIGPQEFLFEPDALPTMCAGEYKVTNEADRMGYRLEGPQLKHMGKADIVSDALCRGAVQVPGNGQPIIMMADCGTTGGYTKIATVIGPDFWRIAQAKPDDTIKFRLCDDTEAVTALREETRRYEDLARLVDNPLSAMGAVPVAASSVRSMNLLVNGQTYKVEIMEVE